MDYEPVIEEIVADKVAFYGHTFLAFGIHVGGWYKVGKSKDLGLEEVEKVLFGTVDCNLPTKEDGTYTTKIVSPFDNWHVWRLNQDSYWHIKLPEEYYDIVEEGSAAAYIDIENRMKYGYYKYVSPIYDAVKRHPRPDVDSYLRRENEGKVTYYHFYGEYVVEQMDIDGESVVRLTEVQSVSDGHFLYDQPFGSINWHYDDFITAEDFYAVWNSQNPAEISRQHAERLSD